MAENAAKRISQSKDAAPAPLISSFVTGGAGEGNIETRYQIRAQVRRFPIENRPGAPDRAVILMVETAAIIPTGDA